MSQILRAIDSSVRFGDRFALNSVSLSISQGERIAIVGPNGAGKSTLLRVLAGITKPVGRVELDGISIDSIPNRMKGRKIAFVPQGAAITFPTTVSDFVMMGRYPFLSRISGPTAEDEKIVNEAIEAVCLAGFENRSILEISAGEMQRALLAGALAQTPSFLLLDESTVFLDPRAQVEILQLLKSLSQSRNMAVVVVTHDINAALKFADKVVGLRNGSLLFSGPPSETITPECLSELYGGNFAEFLDKSGDKAAVLPV